MENDKMCCECGKLACIHNSDLVISIMGFDGKVIEQVYIPANHAETLLTIDNSLYRKQTEDMMAETIRDMLAANPTMVY